MIGAAGPVTGQLASLGEQSLAGVRQAVADINERGGLLGQKLELVVGDDACDPKQAVAVANLMVSKRVAFVAGHLCSGASIPAAAVYAEEGVVMISPASTSPALTETGSSLIFRVCGRDDRQGAIAGAFLAERFAGRPIAILHDRSTYGKGLADAARETLHKAGGREAIYEAITPGEKDFAALVAKLKQTGIAAVFLGGYHTEAGLILRQMREQQLEAALVGGDSLVVREFWSIAGEAAENAYFSFVADPRRSPAAAAVLARFASAGVAADGYVLYSYAAVEAWALAAAKAGTTDPAAVARVLHGESFATVIGTLRFDAKGDVDLPAFAIYRWSKGDYAQIDAAP
ncbi:MULTISPECIES: branched-chain amino acid ABC transporter substrate-binding protein [Rhodomicrobium]|uniref:branched-chain amino acid ABC transporter substrate-binding protein n=1 Tax=Rhodomicrobium TaxID=1068 RepID=UPI000B4B434E|nr:MULTISPECIES: branched-chain amino acid ABC transporter substrate-binding protein [Rhodomicrobium]